MPKTKVSTVSYANEKEKEQAISEANQSNTRVIDLANSVGHVLSFLYLTISHLSDGDLSKEEVLKIGLIVSEWTDLDQEESAQIVEETRAWFIALAMNEDDKISDMLTTCISLLDQKMDHTAHKTVLEDLVAVGKADGNFDDVEKGYVEMIAAQLGINEKWVDSLLNN